MRQPRSIDKKQFPRDSESVSTNSYLPIALILSDGRLAKKLPIPSTRGPSYLSIVHPLIIVTVLKALWALEIASPSPSGSSVLRYPN